MPSPSPRLARYFADYSQFHMTLGNQVCHFLGIPMIVVSLLGLLALIPQPPLFVVEPWVALDGGLILWAVACAWYVYLDWRLALLFAVGALAAYVAARWLPVEVLWGLFIGGWIVQFLGHYKYERKSPAFFKNAEHLLIGPLWIFAKTLGWTRQLPKV